MTGTVTDQSVMLDAQGQRVLILGDKHEELVLTIIRRMDDTGPGRLHLVNRDAKIRDPDIPLTPAIWRDILPARKNALNCTLELKV